MDTVTIEKNEMRIMDVLAGDLKLQWSAGNVEEISAAKKAFEKGKKKGMLFYRQTRLGSKGEQITKFDPDAERIIGVPALRGG